MAFKTGAELEAIRQANREEEERLLAADRDNRNLLAFAIEHYPNLSQRDKDFVESINAKAAIGATLRLTPRQFDWLQDIKERLVESGVAR